MQSTKKKISCKDCKRTCCDNVKVKLSKPYLKAKVRPSDLKVGDWIYVSGITLVKKKNNLFKCRAFDTKTRLCRIWRYRPPLCREFFCAHTRERKRKIPVNEREEYTYYLEFKTCLDELVKGTTTYFRPSSKNRPAA